MRFHSVTFGVAPKREWPRLRRDLLELESGLACEQGEVGCVKDFVFDIDVPEDLRFCHRPTPLPPAQAEWVDKEMEVLCASGIVEPCESCDCASNIVLVD